MTTTNSQARHQSASGDSERVVTKIRLQLQCCHHCHQCHHLFCKGYGGKSWEGYRKPVVTLVTLVTSPLGGRL